MSTEDWYRQSEWTPEASAEFEARLSRSRGQRTEYLRIQALTLSESTHPNAAKAAIELATRFLTLKKTGLGVAQMHASIAKSLTTLGDPIGAIDAYISATDAEYSQPNVRGYHYIDFAWFAATHSRSEIFDKVLSIVERNKNDQDLAFPANQYRFFGAMALISSALGDKQSAARMAQNALRASAQGLGPLKSHPTLGRVEVLDHDIQLQLQHLSVA